MISSQKLMRMTCAFIFCLAVASTSAADIIHDESVNGDLSGDENAPTAFVLTEGSNEIIGSTTGTPLDRDFWQLTIPTGFRLTELTLTEYTNGIGNLAFFAVQEGGSITLDGTGHLGGMLIEEAMDGTDILDDLGSQFISGDGFTPPLPSGDYTFWYQELSDDTTYAMDFVVSPIPEPTSALVVAAFGFAAVVRRKRK